MSDTETEGIRIVVRPRFWAERSEPGQGRYAFTYEVVITNEGREPARLTHRRWAITDAMGEVQEVQGPGVVGKTPRLAPGDHFAYTSWAMIETPFGTMEGHFVMVRPDGRSFNAAIDPFPLMQPHALN